MQADLEAKHDELSRAVAQEHAQLVDGAADLRRAQLDDAECVRAMEAERRADVDAVGSLAVYMRVYMYTERAG